MEIKIVDKTLEDLKNREQASLYGIQKQGVKIISSLNQKSGLKKIGVFSQKKNKKGNFGLVLYFENESLKCCSYSQDIGITELTVEVLPYSSDFNKRNRGILDESILQQRNVTMIGLGSGGGKIALDLIRSGIINQTWIEFDQVSLSNLCRSVYNLVDVGKIKTEALLEKALAINPCANIQIFDEDVLEMDSEKLEQIIETSDLIIEGTDSQKTKILVNGIGFNSTPVIYPAVYENGRGGDILFTLPIEGFPCYECVFRSVIDQNQENKNPEWDYTTGHPKPLPALIADIQVVCARITKLALALLTGDQENSFLEKIIKPGCTLLIITNEKDVSGFQDPFQEKWIETKITPECMCQTLY